MQVGGVGCGAGKWGKGRRGLAIAVVAGDVVPPLFQYADEARLVTSFWQGKLGKGDRPLRAAKGMKCFLASVVYGQQRVGG